MSRFQVWYRVV